MKLKASLKEAIFFLDVRIVCIKVKKQSRYLSSYITV